MAKETKKSFTADDYRKQVAEKFIEVLEMNDKIPWYRGWHNKLGSPISGATGKPYKGLNLVYLTLMTRAFEFKDPRWFAFAAIKSMNDEMVNKAKERGEEIAWEDQIHLIKGSHGVAILDTYPRKIIRDEDGNKITSKRVSWQEFYKDYKDDPEQANRDYYLGNRQLTVFNADQIVNVPKLKLNERDLTTSEIVKSIATNMGVTIKHERYNDRAYYSPDDDEIHLPPESTFKSEKILNAVTLHELAHSTGHKSRLDRDQSGLFADESYAFEELIAEMTSAMMGLYDDDVIDDREMQNHQAYIQSWIREIKDKPKKLEDAIKEAFRASEYMDKHIDPELLKDKEIEAESKNTISTAIIRIDDKIDLDLVLKEMKGKDYDPSKISYVDELPDIAMDDRRYRSPMNAFETALLRGMKDPENWEYNYSYDNYDYFENKESKEACAIAQFPRLEMVRRKVYDVVNETYQTKDEYDFYNEYDRRFDLPKGYVSNEPDPDGALGEYEESWRRSMRQAIEKRYNSKEYDEELLNDENIRKGILQMANEEKKINENTERVAVNLPKFAIEERSFKSKYDPNKDVVYVRVPDADGNFSYPIRKFLIAKDRIKEDQKHPESRCFISFAKDKELKVYKKKLEGEKFVDDGFEMVKVDDLKAAYTNNWNKYKEKQSTKEQDFEDDMNPEMENDTKERSR